MKKLVFYSLIALALFNCGGTIGSISHYRADPNNFEAVSSALRNLECTGYYSGGNDSIFYICIESNFAIRTVLTRIKKENYLGIGFTHIVTLDDSVSRIDDDLDFFRHFYYKWKIESCVIKPINKDKVIVY